MKQTDPSKLTAEAMQRADALRHDERTAGEIFQWLAESPRHVEELMFAQQVLDEIAELTPEQRQRLESAAESAGISELPDSKVVPLGCEEIRLLAPSTRGRGTRSNRTWKPHAIGIAASLATLAVAGWLWLGRGSVYGTEVGEQRTVQLLDGSLVYLNTASEVRVVFSGASRSIELLRGEALFTVAPDESRPFRVDAGATVVQALGTQFNVLRRGEDVRVSVIEGRVRVISSGESAVVGAGSDGGLLGAGDEASVAGEGGLVKRKLEDPARVVAWRDRRLVFRGNSLAEIAAEFNRYNRSPRIRIADPAAGEQRFTGTFDADAPQALMQALAPHRAVLARRFEREIIIETRR
jgi:transmembrane sensor